MNRGHVLLFLHYCRRLGRTERGIATGEEVGGGSKEEKRVESASNQLIM